MAPPPLSHVLAPNPGSEHGLPELSTSTAESSRAWQGVLDCVGTMECSLPQNPPPCCPRASWRLSILEGKEVSLYLGSCGKLHLQAGSIRPRWGGAAYTPGAWRRS